MHLPVKQVHFFIILNNLNLIVKFFVFSKQHQFNQRIFSLW